MARDNAQLDHILDKDYEHGFVTDSCQRNLATWFK